MKDFIRRRIREEVIDGQNMNSGIKKFCNEMSIPKDWLNHDYQYIIEFLTKYIGPQNGPNSALWKRIESPLKQWKQQEISINKQVKKEKMSGGSNPDNNTYWTAIQSTICEQGSDSE
jgi:hypothetical protein